LGDRVSAKVAAIKEDGKIDLSIKALQDPPPQTRRRGSDPEFEQMAEEVHALERRIHVPRGSRLRPAPHSLGPDAGPAIHRR